MWLFYSHGEGATEKSVREPTSIFYKFFWTICSNCSVFLTSDRHPVVILQFFEVICRFGKFLIGNQDVPATELPLDRPSFLLQISKAMLGSFGILHADPAIRARVSDLFLRLVKDVRNAFLPILSELLSLLAPYLDLRQSPPFSTLFAGSQSTYNVTSSLWLLAGYPSFPSASDIPTTRPLRSSEQMYLFEATGILLSQLANTLQTVETVSQLLSPIVLNLKSYLKSVVGLSNFQVSASDLDNVCVHVSAIANVCKPFTSGRFSSFLSLFLELSSLVLAVYSADVVGDVRVVNQTLRERVFFFFHRMVDCLGLENRWTISDLLERTLFMYRPVVDALPFLECLRMMNQCAIRLKADSVGILERV